MSSPKPMSPLRLLLLILSLTAMVFSIANLIPEPVADGAPYRYLAIGNSITRHPICPYWWDECGMAASWPEKDYFHQVMAWLKKKHAVVEAEAVNFVEWETANENREETYPVIDPYLTDDLNLITVQLSENVTRLRGFEQNCAALIRHIQEKCPNAKIVLVDDFWSDPKSGIKRRVAQWLGVPFADLSEIRGDAAYQWQVGDIVYGSDGATHAITREDVARHPNNNGMAYIAQAIIDHLR